MIEEPKNDRHSVQPPLQKTDVGCSLSSAKPKTHWDVYEDNKDFISSTNLLGIRDRAVSICKELEQSYRETGNGHAELVWNAVALLADAVDMSFRMLRSEYGSAAYPKHQCFLRTLDGNPYLQVPQVRINDQQ